jgi:hypothetical protein
MTSEVVVMNRLGIALASDSAATVYHGGRAKVYHADKLFMLSQFHPVGVMTYNNSALLGIPWETIIKMFRGRLGNKEFPTLEEYADAFLEHLNDNLHLFPLEVQKRTYLELIETLYNGISREINAVVMKMITDGDDDPESHKQEAHKIIMESLGEWRTKENAKCFEPPIADQMAGQYSGEIHELIAKYFGVWQIESSAASALRELAILMVSKDDILEESLSGLVIAGYGGSEYFPVMKAFELGAIFRGKLKYKVTASESIDSKNSAVIRPFAESDMVLTFLNGLSPTFELKLLEEITQLVVQLPDLVIDQIAGISAKRKKAIKEYFYGLDLALVKDLKDKLEQHRLQKHLESIRQGIAFLPKNELALVAATLVNLNTFQKRMSATEEETVGGPIDVAVISKGDGFVWVNRKHYFPASLNPHFFRNYGLPVSSKGGASHEEN